jgi:hypothetical protein
VFKKIFIAIIPILFLFSCEKKQELRQKTESRQQAISGCKNSSFVGDVLSKENTLNLFRCLGWHLELASLYSELEEINSSDWDLFSKPLNEVFFKEANHELRAELFSFFYKLEANGSLDQLSIFLSKVDFKGLSDFVGVIFRCQTIGKCSENDLRMAKALVPNEDTYQKIILFLSYFKKSLIENDANLLVNNLGDFLSDKKIEDLIFEFIKNNDSLIFNDVSSQIVFPSVRDFIFKESSGQSMLFDFTRQFKNKNDFYKYLNEDLISSLFKLSPSFRIISKHNGQLPCQIGSDSSLSNFDLDYRLLNFINRTIGPDPALGRSLIEETAFTLLANQLCKNLPSFSHNLKRYNLYSTTPFYEILDTKLSLESFNKELILFLSNKFNHQLLSYFYELVNENIGEKNKLRDTFYLVNMDDFNLVHDFSEYIFTEHSKLLQSLSEILYSSDLNLYYLTSYFMSKIENSPELTFLIKDMAKRLEKENIAFSRNLLSQFFKLMEKPKESLGNLVSLLNISEDLPIVLGSEWFDNPSSLDSIIRFFTSTSAMLERPSVKGDVSRLVSSRFLIRAVKLLSLGGRSQIPTVEEIIEGIKKISFIKNEKNYKKLIAGIGEKESQCIDALSSDTFSLTKILSGLPTPCKELDAPGELILLISDINRLNIDISEEEYQSYGEELELFNEDLFGNKSFMGDGILFLDNMYNIFYKKNEKNVEDLVEDIFDFISKDELITFVDNFFSLLKSYFDADPEKQIFHRNYFISDYMDEISPNGEKSYKFLLDLNSHLSDFNQKFIGVTESEVSAYKSCDEYFIFWIGHDECQDAASISKSLHSVTKLLLRKNGVNRPTALEMLLKLALPKEGVEIPYKAQKKRKVVFSAKEMMEMAVNVNDPKLIFNGKRVNSQIMDFWLLNQKNKKEKKRYLMTTSQRMETTVREVQFDLNYLGVSYMNTVARGVNYSKTVKSNFKLLKRCALYLRYCMRFFSKQEHLMVKNGIATYPALWDLEDYWGHGDAMQGLVTSLVASSSKKAAKADIINFKGFRIPSVPSDKELKKHNGSIFTQLSMISVFSNFGRVLETRLGSFSSAREFIESQNFSVFSQHFLKNINYDLAKDSASKALVKTLKYKDQNNLTITERIVEWVSDKDKVQSMIIQNIASDIAMISPFIGMDTESYFGPDVWVEPKYKKNSLDSAVVFFNDFMDVWTFLFDELDVERQRTLLRNISFLTSFIKDGLYSSGLEKSLFFFEMTNEAFYLVNKYLYEYEYDQLKGIDYLKLSFYDRETPRKLNSFLNSLNDLSAAYKKEDLNKLFLNVDLLLKENNGEIIKDFINNILEIISIGVRELNVEDGSSIKNKNFNFYESLVRYVSIKDPEGRSKVHLFSHWLNDKKNKDAVLEVLKNFLGMISPSL